ncbi:MAG: type II toxin-antitoxin system RelE/ParE family toxin [Bacteroidales bacterium]|nr:type II toxin-antitoxin system RelE/ParE family toxin [Bacteroidales bacterium]
MAKFKIEWSIEARLDLLDILDFYVIRKKSAAYSKKLNSKIYNSTKLIAKQPYIGTQTGIDTVRALVTGDYQIIYEIPGNKIMISMIWDCHRDPEDKIIDSREK